ncbi:MAG: hypothetical protein OXU20_08970 [Myxococcales bacterium]|nr:hypothetical protein [Myxococcales bacterium]MDD9969593.1 hypothetical protein [Myxococcales bacterium]
MTQTARRMLTASVLGMGLLACSGEGDSSPSAEAPGGDSQVSPPAAGASGTESQAQTKTDSDADHMPAEQNPTGGEQADAPENMAGDPGAAKDLEEAPEASDPEGAAGEPGDSNPGADGVDTTDPTTAFADLPDDCRGFDVEGLTHSPGGDVLPNTCAPYHGVRNNPFAIRCIDADPSYNSGFPGDEWCILPPDPELGTQVKVSPESYDDPAPWFLMSPGQEFNDYYYSEATNQEERYFYRVNIRMRAGSHHMINTMLSGDREDGPASLEGLGVGRGSGRTFPGAQRPDQDRPMSLEVAPENENLGARMDPRQQFSLNLHHFNFGEEMMLREVWINIWYKEQAEVTEELRSIGIFGNPLDLNIPPGEHRELHYACPVTADTRIVRLNGHRHSSTSRFAIWMEQADGESVTLYESFDYYDMPTYQFDSITTNPTPSLEEMKDGGYTGILNAKAGDEIHFLCDVTNRGDRPLRFANEVETGEMCIVFGSRTGGSICSGARRVQ